MLNTPRALLLIALAWPTAAQNAPADREQAALDREQAARDRAMENCFAKGGHDCVVQTNQGYECDGL